MAFSGQSVICQDYLWDSLLAMMAALPISLVMLTPLVPLFSVIIALVTPLRTAIDDFGPTKLHPLIWSLPPSASTRGALELSLAGLNPKLSLLK